MGTTLQGKKPGGADATFRWLLHLGNHTLDSPRRVSTGSGLDTGLVIGADSIGIANAGGHVLTFDTSALTAGRSVIWRDEGGTVAFLADIAAAIDNLIGGAPGALDTLQELAAALGDDENFASTVAAALAAIPEFSEGGNGEDDAGKGAIFDGDGGLAGYSFRGGILLAEVDGSAAYGLLSPGYLRLASAGGANGEFLPPVTGSGLQYVMPSASGTLALSSQTLNLTGDQTAAGAKTFSGQVELTGQAATTANSAMTRGLADARYMLRSGIHSLASLTIIDVAMGWTANSAIGGSTTTASGRSLTVAASTTLGSEAYLRTSGFQPVNYTYPGMDASGGNAGVNWSKKTYLGFRMAVAHATNNSPQSSTEGYVRFGLPRTYATYGDLNARGIGLKIVAGSLFPMVHDGTTLNLGGAPFYTTASALSPVNLIEILGDGAGTFYFFANGVLGATLTGGPTGFGGQEATATNIMIKNVVGGANTNCQLTIANGQFIFGYLD